MNSIPIETEKKYLIAYPDTAALAAMPGAAVWEIEQTYLLAPENVTARIRRVAENGRVRWIYTEKIRITGHSAYENEREVTEEEAQAYLKTADPTLRTIRKTRYRIPHGDFCAEIDVFPFWRDRALLEIELPDDGVSAPIPDYVSVIADVSDDSRYKNRAMANAIPNDSI